MWLFFVLYGKNQNYLVCLAMSIWRSAFYMRARTHSTIQYFASFSSVFIFFFFFFLSFNGLSFACCLFLAAYEILACDTFFFFAWIYQSILYISHHATAGEYVYIYTRIWREERREKNKVKKRQTKTTKTVYLRKPEEKMKQWCN